MKTLELNYSEEKTKDLVEHIKDLGWEVTEENGAIIINEGIDSGELFEMAAIWAKDRERTEQTKPESILYELKYAKMLEKGLQVHLRRAMLSNSSIKFEYGQPAMDLAQLAISPTKASVLIGMGTEYGRMLEQEQQAKNEKASA